MMTSTSSRVSRPATSASGTWIVASTTRRSCAGVSRRDAPLGPATGGGGGARGGEEGGRGERGGGSGDRGGNGPRFHQGGRGAGGRSGGGAPRVAGPPRFARLELPDAGGYTR